MDDMSDEFTRRVADSFKKTSASPSLNTFDSPNQGAISISSACGSGREYTCSICLAFMRIWGGIRRLRTS